LKHGGSELSRVPISKPVLEDREINLVVEVLKSGNLAQGEKVHEFEERFADYIDVEHAVAVTNGTAALDLALHVGGVSNGDEVITTPFTFIATANSVMYQGGRPIFADIDERTFNLTPSDIEKRITNRTKAIIPVHLFGNPADMVEIMEIARDRHLLVVEDAAQAHGAAIDSKKVGSFGDLSVFSFYATKNMTTGEGGMITTNNSEFAAKLRLLRDQGQLRRYEHTVLGFNLRMTDIQGAIGIGQLERLEEMTTKRIGNALHLSNQLARIPHVATPYTKQGYRHVFHQYSLRIDGSFPMPRDSLLNALTEHGIGARMGYPRPIYLQPLYRDMGYADRCPVTESIIPRIVQLPIHPGVLKEDLDEMISVIEHCANPKS
jgi:perosamine synthetase